MRILIKTDAEVDAVSYPRIPKSRNPDLIKVPTPLHLRCGCNCLQAISGFVYFSYFCCKRTTLVGFRFGVCQIDRREFRLQISAVQLACKVKTYIKNIYSKTQMNLLKNRSSSWRGTSEPPVDEGERCGSGLIAPHSHDHQKCCGGAKRQL